MSELVLVPVFFVEMHVARFPLGGPGRDKGMYARPNAQVEKGMQQAPVGKKPPKGGARVAKETTTAQQLSGLCKKAINVSRAFLKTYCATSTPVVAILFGYTVPTLLLFSHMFRSCGVLPFPPRVG